MEGTKKITTELVFPFATPSLNETKSEHWSKKTARRKRYEKYIMALTRNKHLGRVRVEVYRLSRGVLDHDNFVGGAKDCIDALKNRGVIVDDTDKIIVERHYEQQRVKLPAQVMTIVRITDL